MTESLVDTGRVHPHEGTILVVAARAMGVSIGHAEITYIRAASRLAAAIDDMVDNQQQTPDIAHMLASPDDTLAAHFDVQDRKLIGCAIDGLSAMHREAWLQAEQLPQHAAEKREAATVKELSRALSAEAVLFGNVFSLDSGSSADRSAREKYNAWVKHFSRGGYHVDQAVDMRIDRREGRIAVLPSVRNRGYLFGIATQELAQACQLVASPRIIWELGKTASATVREGQRSDSVLA